MRGECDVSEPYEIASVVPAGLDPWRAVTVCDDVLRAAAIVIDDDSQLYLNDTDRVEPEPQSVHSPAEALRTLASWPTLGTIEYASAEGPVTVSYLSDSNPPLLHCVILGVGQRAMDRAAGVGRYQRLAEALDTALGASRTIMAWGLNASGFSWSDELNRLRRGLYERDYELADLRTYHRLAE